MLEKLYKLNPSDYEKLYKGELVTIGTRTLQLNLSDYSLTVDGASPAIPSADYTIEVSDTYATDDEIENMFSDQESVATPQDVANLFNSFDPATRQFLLDLVYPVGSIFQTTSSDYDTAAKVKAHFGGEWEDLGTHYIPKGDVVVGTSTTEGFNPSAASINAGAPLKLRPAYNGSILGESRFLGYYKDANSLCYSNDAGTFTATGGMYPSNLWVKNTNTTYNTAIHLFKRTA